MDGMIKLSLFGGTAFSLVAEMIKTLGRQCAEAENTDYVDIGIIVNYRITGTGKSLKYRVTIDAPCEHFKDVLTDVLKKDGADMDSDAACMRLSAELAKRYKLSADAMINGIIFPHAFPRHSYVERKVFNEAGKTLASARVDAFDILSNRELAHADRHALLKCLSSTIRYHQTFGTSG